MSAKFLKQYKAVIFVNHPKRPKLTNKAAAKYMRKFESFVKKWVKRYLEVGNVDDLPERGLSKRGFDCLFLFMDNLNAEKMRSIW